MARHRPPLTEKTREQWRPKDYAASEKRRLVRVVGGLCARLGRPVSAADLKGWFAHRGAERPELCQRLGQVLIKAARPRPAPLPGLRRVGIHGALAYYCVGPDADGRWARAFSRFILEQRLASAAREGFVEAVSTLLDTEAHAAAQALAGWLVEADDLAGRCVEAGIDSADLGSLHEEITAARPRAAARFTPCAPADLVGRSEADALLRSEFARRGFEVDQERLSTGRLFSLLRPWPVAGGEMDADRPGGSARYGRSQVLALCAWRWPRDDEDPERSRARFLAARYGGA